MASGKYKGMKYLAISLEQYDNFCKLSGEELAAVVLAAMRYAIDGTSTSFDDRFVAGVFESLVRVVDYSAARAAEISERRKAAGAKGGLQKAANLAAAGQTLAIDNKGYQMLANASKCYQTLANHSININDKNKDKLERGGMGGGANRAAHLKEVQEFFGAAQITELDATQFFAVMESRGWTDAQGEPLSDWRAYAQRCNATQLAGRPQENSTKRDTTRKEKRFEKPTFEEAAAYVAEKSLSIDVQEFFDHYEANGWKVGRSSMKDWRAALRNWARRSKEYTHGAPSTEIYRNSDEETQAGAVRFN